MMTVLHVVFGTLALGIAPVALFVRKGGTWHRRCGAAFALTMAIVLFSAGFLWQAKGHLFLVPLAGVSAYLIFNGFRVIARHRRPVPDPLEDRFDLLADAAAFAAGVSVAYMGSSASTPLMISLRPALLGIGVIAIAFAVNDMLGFSAPRRPLGWLFAHFAAMIAAYISAVTAFLVINAHGVPMLLRWIVPSFVGGGVIVAYTLSYLRRGRVRPVVAPATAPGRRSSYNSIMSMQLSRTAGSRGEKLASHQSSSRV